MEDLTVTEEDLDWVKDKLEEFDDKTIFRYMDMDQFMDLLRSGTLYFTNSKNIDNGDEDRQAYEESAIYMNCWSELSKESVAMWKTYTDPLRGIAIKTTIGSLKNALEGQEVDIYKIGYTDSFEDIDDEYGISLGENGNDDGEKDQGLSQKIIYKLKSYEYENEIRAVYLGEEDLDGINIPVDLDKLIEEIFLSPYVPDWFVKLVDNIAQSGTFDINNKPIHRSNILVKRANGQ